MASFIPHPEAFVHDFLQVIDIILEIGQNKNTLDGFESNIDKKKVL
jgi:hypothetical protein